MELQNLGLERYKGYAEPVQMELAPLTILVGANNSGKTALAQAIQLLAESLIPSKEDSLEPVPLESGGIRHGETFEDLVTGRMVHGWLRLSATLTDKGGQVSISATVRNVLAQSRPSVRQISEWCLTSGDNTFSVERQGFEESSNYLFPNSGYVREHQPIVWRGLLPRDPYKFPDWVVAQVDALKIWALGVRHLRCPRSLLSSPFSATEHPPFVLGPDGRNTPLVLAADDELRDSVREWYRNVFGVSIDIAAQGSYSDLVVRAQHGDENVRLDQSGRGLSHVLPVVVTALTARKAGSGADVIEHPEAELHPAAHAHIAELLLENLAGRKRPMVVETHSEMVLLRVRRWVAEGRLPPEDVLVYWIDTEPGRGSILRKIGIRAGGEMVSWPDGVFVEDYEEILAIRRAARPTDLEE